MIRRFWFFLLCSILGLFVALYIWTESSVQYHLSLGSLIPATGQETVRRLILSMADTSTNLINGEKICKNEAVKTDLEFKCKVLVWNTNQDYCKADLILDHFTAYGKNYTNELVKSGEKVSATYVAGQWFFESPSDIPGSVKRLLGNAFEITPREGVRQFEDGFQLDQSRVIGESWPMKFNFEGAPDRINSIVDPTVRFWAGVGLANMNATNMPNGVQFVGITNISGIEAFDLRANLRFHEDPAHMYACIEASREVVAPFDGSHKDWTMTSKFDGVGFPDGSPDSTNFVSIGAHISKTVLVQCREMTNLAAGD